MRISFFKNWRFLSILGDESWRSPEKKYYCVKSEKGCIHVIEQIKLSIERELVNIMERIEERGPEPSKEWEDVWRKKLYEWKKV